MNIAVTNPRQWSEEGLTALGNWHLFQSPKFFSHETEVLCVRVDTFVDAEWFERMPNLQVIVSPTTGLDHIDLDECKKRGIEVISLQGEREFLDTIPATAEHTFALILALYRRIPSNHQFAIHAQWHRAERGRTLKGKTLGIVGYGRLGSMVLRMAHGFGIKPIAYDPYVQRGSFQYDSLIKMVSVSDILTLHVPLTPETTGMINKYILDALPAGAVLINTSRGAVVDESALLESLVSGKLAGAALDVLANEHTLTSDHPLLTYARTHDNLILTPHTGGNTVESVRDTDLFIINKLKQWMEANHASQNNR